MSHTPETPLQPALRIVQNFLEHLFAGRLPQALTLVSPGARFVSARGAQAPETLPLKGTFMGPAGAQRFFELFGEMLEPGEFHIDGSFGQGAQVALYGRLRHIGRATGKPFATDWALICEVRHGLIDL
ncbi:nuclear transport factor 2 family protein [Ottowia testudinis]|uniref:Nuclear transport factor 2 family protein n=1 Tax=Ottowia testudinis TaxID=2816950 RepID=A0A975H1W4_9BURK|nr:nuclear transport factor 2 family protein [Ottowia testudinis]QTD44253.1 nuclear transport factor 2 family protein [Ottowia testudinis]